MSLQPTSTNPSSPSESDGYAAAAALATADLGRGGLLASGTWTRHVGLYDLSSPPVNACVATWGVAKAADDLSEGGKIGGKGIVQTLWSPCGRYLLVNERRSRGLLVYDIRVNGKLLGSLTGRDADTNQRLSCAVYASADGSAQGGFEVWAGDIRGRAHVWETVGSHEGPQQPIWGWNAHDKAIGAVAMHASGSVAASCSGCWKIDDDTIGDDNSRPSLRIWRIGSSACG
jgi:telomerase Cajal body protein 1